MMRREIAESLRRILIDEIGEEYGELDDTTTLRDGLELDSVDMISLVLKIENEFKIQIQSDALEGIETIGQLLDLLEVRANPPKSEAA
jgi:acyl carrier protein